MGYQLELKDGSSNTATIEPDDIISASLPDEHSVINEWTITVPESPSLEDWELSEAYIYAVDGSSKELLVRGELDKVNTKTSSAITTLKGQDGTRKLKRGGAAVRYTSIPYWNATQDYFDTYTPFDATVHEPETRTIDEDKVVQDATTTAEFDEIVSPASTEPAAVRDDRLEELQTCFTVEAENPDRDTDPAYWTDRDDLSGGDGRGVYSSSSVVEWDFTPEHTIPADQVGMHCRVIDTDDAQECEWVLVVDGTEHVLDYLSGGEGALLTWRDFANNPYNGDGYTGGDIPAGASVTFKLRSTGTNGGSLGFDVVAFADNRFDYTFDNDVHEPQGYLNGPQYYPKTAQILFAVEEQTFNITAANLVTSMTNTETQQSLAVTNDGGSTFEPSDGTGQNTETISVDFDTVGTTIQGRVTLSRGGQRDTATPRTGFEPQHVESWELSIDTNDLAVIDDREYVGSHYENIQQLHKDGGMRFVAQHAENALPVESFEPGQIVKSADWTRTDHERTKNVRKYANSVTAWGAVDEATGERLKATAKSESAIDADGEEIEAPPLFEPKIESEADLKSLVRTELSKRLAVDELSGSVQIAPKAIAPGYSYEVPALDNKTLSLERVQFQDGTQGARGTLEFVEQTDLAARLSGISSDVKSVKDAF